ncbi:hypothetical protein OROGR_008147 [Orobanche gracilis]
MGGVLVIGGLPHIRSWLSQHQGEGTYMPTVQCRQTLFGGDAVMSARHRINPMPSLVLGREVYTCWPTNSGAEEFNFGSRIDHILSAGPCLHKEENHGDSFVTCHVKECDILRQFKRWKPGNTPRHKDIKGRIQLKGSDHVPVYMSLMGIPNIQQHNTPSLSTRYCPEVYGCQQTVVSMFTRRQPAEEISLSGESSSVPVQMCSQLLKRPHYACRSSSDSIDEGVFCTSYDCCEGSYKDSSAASPCSETGHMKSLTAVVSKKKARESRWSQLSLKSFFQKTVGAGDLDSICSDRELTQANISIPYCESNETLMQGCEHDAVVEWQLRESTSMQENNTLQYSEKEKNNVALVEWQRIQQLMQTSKPLCKGHKEPCVSRVVKKFGPNLGRRFYVCARAEADLRRILKRTVVFSNGLLRSQRTGKFDGPRTMKMWLNIPATKIYLSYAHLLGFSKRLYEDEPPRHLDNYITTKKELQLEERKLVC